MPSTFLTPAQTGYIAGICKLTVAHLSFGPPPTDPADTSGFITAGSFLPCRPPVLPPTAGFSEAKLFDLYARFVEWHGDSLANAALASGQQVIVGLRCEVSTRVNQGQGIYNDRIALIWQDLPTKPTMQMLPTANRANVAPPAQPVKHGFDFTATTQPSAQYEDRGTHTTTVMKGGKPVKVQVPNKIIGPDGREVLPSPTGKIEGGDVNHDGRLDLGRLVPGTYEFHFATGKKRLKLGYEYLHGNSRQLVQRDTNHDGYFTTSDVWQTPSGHTVVETGDFAILIHRGGDTNTWSAACQTMPTADYRKFLSKMKRSQISFYYVLVTLR